MVTVFDTLKFANKLEAAGVADKQAEAEASVAWMERSGIRESFAEPAFLRDGRPNRAGAAPNERSDGSRTSANPTAGPPTP